MKFLTSENHSMGFFFILNVCGVGACQSEWKWMWVIFAGCIQLKNHDFKVKNKKSAFGVNKLSSSIKIMSQKPGLHENWWKSLQFHLMKTDHDLCLNLCLDQSLIFAIRGTKVLQNGTKDSKSSASELLHSLSITYMLLHFLHVKHTSPTIP